MMVVPDKAKYRKSVDGRYRKLMEIPVRPGYIPGEVLKRKTGFDCDRKNDDITIHKNIMPSLSDV